MLKNNTLSTSIVVSNLNLGLTVKCVYSSPTLETLESTNDESIYITAPSREHDIIGIYVCYCMIDPG